MFLFWVCHNWATKLHHSLQQHWRYYTCWYTGQGPLLSFTVVYIQELLKSYPSRVINSTIFHIPKVFFLTRNGNIGFKPITTCNSMRTDWNQRPVIIITISPSALLGQGTRVSHIWNKLYLYNLGKPVNAFVKCVYLIKSFSINIFVQIRK